MTIKPVGYAELLKHADLLAEYAAECSIHEIGAINPQPDIYEAMERAGISRMFGAFSEGFLIGFASMLVTVLPHYGQKTATVESLFVSEPFRKTGAGLGLMAAMEDYASEAGCKAMLYSAPTGGKLERLLSRRKGSRRTNAVFCIALNP